MKAVLVLAALASTAVADPPAPVVMPALDTNNEVSGDAKLGTRGPTLADAASIRGRYHLLSFFEVTGRLPLLRASSNESEGGSGFKGGAIAFEPGLRLRGRIDIDDQHFDVAYGVELVTRLNRMEPSYETFARTPDAFDRLIGLPDPFLVTDDATLVQRVDVAWSNDSTFAQLEVGAGIVFGPTALDRIFGSIGAGTYIGETTTIAAEVRLLQEPTGPLYSGALLWATEMGLARQFGANTGRILVGVSNGLMLGVDTTWRL